jgi:hypothetical protein
MVTRKKSARDEAREYWELLSWKGKQRIAGELKQSPPRDDARNVADSGLGADELALPVLKEVAKLARMSLIWTGRRPPELDQAQLKLILDGLKLVEPNMEAGLYGEGDEQTVLRSLRAKISEASKAGGLDQLSRLQRSELALSSRAVVLKKRAMLRSGANINMRNYNDAGRLQEKLDDAASSTFY